MAVPYLACMTLVASLYHLPPGVLPAIRTVEGGKIGLAHPNTNGTEDLGLMQVNTLWIAPLARYTGLAASAVRARLLNEPCFNIAAAGAIMATYLSRGARRPVARGRRLPLALPGPQRGVSDPGRDGGARTAGAARAAGAHGAAPLSPAEQVHERRRVGGRAHLGIVVEEDEHVAPGRPS